MKEMTFDEMAKLYCERQQNEPEELLTILLKQREQYNPTGFMLLECQMMDSSYMGSLVVLVYGPNNTYKEIPNHPISPRGLASDMSTVIGFVPAEKLVTHKVWDYAALKELIEKRAELARKTTTEASKKRGKVKKQMLEYARGIQAAVEVACEILGENVPDREKEERIKAVFLKAIAG